MSGTLYGLLAPEKSEVFTSVNFSNFSFSWSISICCSTIFSFSYGKKNKAKLLLIMSFMSHPPLINSLQWSWISYITHWHEILLQCTGKFCNKLKILWHYHQSNTLTLTLINIRHIFVQKDVSKISYISLCRHLVGRWWHTYQHVLTLYMCLWRNKMGNQQKCSNESCDLIKHVYRLLLPLWAVPLQRLFVLIKIKSSQATSLASIQPQHCW